jgi:adenylate cyclase
MNTIIDWFKKFSQKWNPLLIAIFIGFLVFLALLELRHFGLLQVLELKAYDFKQWGQKQLTPLDDRIVLILANDEDQRQLGWPFLDTQLVQLLKNIQAGKPQVIGLDIYRDLPVPLHHSEGYDELVQLFQEYNNIIGIYKYQDSKGASVAPPPTLEQKGQIGFNDIPADVNGIIRRHLLYMADEHGQTLEYFGLKVAIFYLD